MSVQQEGIEYLIDAEDRATAKVRAVTENIESQAQAVRETGSQAKASTELVGTLAAQLGSSGIGQFTGELAQLIERVSAFSEVSQAGAAGATAFKAGLVGAAAVVSVNIGKALGDIVFQTDAWTKKLEKANEIAGQLDAKLSSLVLDRFNISGTIDKGPEAIERQLESIDRMLAGIGSQADTAKRRLKEIDESWTIFYGREEQEQALATATERANELTQKRVELVKALNSQGPNARQLEIIAKQNAMRKKSGDLVVDLMNQEELLRKQGAEKLRFELQLRGVLFDDLDAAMKLQQNINRLKDAELEKERRLKLAQQEKRDAIRQRISDEQKQVAELRKQLQAVGQSRSTFAGPNQAAQNQRLLTGAGTARFQKTAETVELERQTKLQAKTFEIQKQIAETMRRIEQGQQTLKVISDG